jgi:hypothetical protein
VEKFKQAILSPAFILSLLVALIGLAKYVFSLDALAQTTSETVKIHIAQSAVEQDRYIQTQKQLTELKTQMDILLPEMQRLNRRLDDAKGIR